MKLITPRLAAFALPFILAPAIDCAARKAAESIFEPPHAALEQRIEEPLAGQPVHSVLEGHAAPVTPAHAKSPVPSAKSFDEVSDDVLLGMLVYGEARNAPDYIQEMIARTVYSRSGKGKWWGNTPREVILKPWQYSCFNPNDPNRAKMLNPSAYEPVSVWERCYSSAQRASAQATSGTGPSSGATHFYTCSVSKGKESRTSPSWADGINPVASHEWADSQGVLRRIRFYRLEK